jgi:hypothetical protein
MNEQEARPNREQDGLAEASMESGVSREEQDWRGEARMLAAQALQARVLDARQQGREASDDVAARKAEAERAIAQILEMVRGAERVGSRLAFTWWVEGGALTLVKYRAEVGDGPVMNTGERKALKKVLRVMLTDYTRGRTGEVEVQLRRGEEDWDASFKVAREGARPPEAKTLPVRRVVGAEEATSALAERVRAWLKAIQVPEGGAARAQWQVHLEDGRLLGWEMREYRQVQAARGEGTLAWPPSMEREIVNILQPLTEGLGKRTVRMGLWAEHSLGASKARGWVEHSEIERPPPDPDWSWYKAMHEGILRRWREEVEEGAKWLAEEGAKETALWLAGGIVERGMVLLVPGSLKVVRAALGRGEAAASGWLRTMLTRLPAERRRTFEQLWRKALLEGESSLSNKDRDAIRGMMEGIEHLARQPLGKDEKRHLREAARGYYKELYPHLAALMDSNPTMYPIHHRRPLEYCHLFPTEDINAAENLILAHYEVHVRIGSLWTNIRQRPKALTAQEVDQIAEVIDKHFKHWYHRTAVREEEKAILDVATNTAHEELRALFPDMK